MAYAAAALTVAAASPSERSAYLRKVGALTTLGLLIAAASGFVSAGVLSLLPFLANGFVATVLLFGCWGVAQFVGGALVHAQPLPARILGFSIGAVFEGMALGFLMLDAIVISDLIYGHPLVFIGQAMMLTGLLAFGMFLYLMTGPRKLSIIFGALSMLSMPMFALMILSFIYPVGGFFGMLLSFLFVLFSAGALLYQLNAVMHQYETTEWVPGAFTVMMGLLSLFWNLLVLMMRTQSD